MTYEGAINHALDKEVRADLDKCLADKDESQLTDDERKYLKRKKEKKSYTLNVRFTESEMQDILSKCEQYGYKNKTEYIRDCVRARVDLTPDRSEITCPTLQHRSHLCRGYYRDKERGKRNLAYTSIHTIRATVSAAIAYITRDDKTIDGLYVNSYACRADSAGASEDFRAVRNTGTGRTQILAYHMIQSFAPVKSRPNKLCRSERSCAIEKCSECSIEYVYKPSNKVKLKFRLSGDGQQKFTRADTLGADFTPERIAEQIAEIQEKLSAANVTPDMLIEAPKPVVPKTEPKPTQTVTAPTKPKQSAEPETITETSETAKRKAAAEQVEKFFAARRARRQAQLDMLNATAINPKPEPSARTPQPTPTESKAPEKKEDPWKAIRGMGRANEIIADLEAGGVMSFSELSGFFFNTPHSDDHTTERADLKKKFTAIDTLIAKMKHRDELEPVYKEYQGKSGWSQSRFKKKNAATIEDYEQTVKYIKEHIKKYAVDGKPPTMLDLLEKSNKLKSKWNRLNVEHTAFLTKRETAKKYTRQVRQYINEQQMKREREKSRQRTQAKHRNKNTLE